MASARRVASPLYITSGILLFPRLDALTAVGLFVTGQVFASLCLDLFGLLGIPRQPLSIGIVLGAVAVLVGITMIVRGQQTAQPAKAKAPAAASAVSHGSGSSLASSPKPAATSPGRGDTGAAQVGWIVLGLAAGIVLPIQGAVNAKLRSDLDEPITVALISFIVATLAIAVVLLILLTLRRTPAPQLRPLTQIPWWGWLGGLCAAAYVTATFLLIPEIGAATTVALTVTGQQLASAAVDNYGLFQLPQRALTTPRLAGLGFLVAGSVLVQLT